MGDTSGSMTTAALSERAQAPRHALQGRRRAGAEQPLGGVDVAAGSGFARCGGENPCCIHVSCGARRVHNQLK